MNLISAEAVMEKANQKYVKAKMNSGLDLRCTAPELLSVIHSDQVKAVAEALVDEVNLRFAALTGWTK